jgi:outer membrane lipoprotein LolB
MRIQIIIRHLIVISVAALLSGCVSLHVGKVEQDFSKQSVALRQKDLQAISNFNIVGALSITNPQKTYLVNYQWQQNGVNYKIKLASSLNAVSYELYGAPHKVILRQARQQDVIANNVGALMQRELGYVLPLQGMRYWILGLPDPSQYSATRDSFGHLQTLQQNGWQINYLLYQSYNKMDLPRLLKISGHNLKIKFVIKQWQLK